MPLIPPEIKTEIIKLEPDGAVLWLLEIRAGANSYFFVNNSDRIVFDGITYQPFSFGLELETEENTGRSVGASIVVDDPLQLLNPTLVENAGFVDKPIVLKQVHTAHLNNPASFIPYQFQVTDFSRTEAAASFRLGSIDFFRRLVPQSRFSRNSCGWPEFNNTRLVVTDASNASPIILTFDRPHRMQTYDRILVKDIVGNTAANGGFRVEFVDENRVALIGTTGNGAYVSGGIATDGQGGGCGYLGQSVGVAEIRDSTPIEVVCSQAHAMRTGQFLNISGTSITAANGDWFVTVIDSVTFSIDGSTAAGAAGAGGVVSYILQTCDRSMFGGNGCRAHQNEDRFRGYLGMVQQQ